MVESYTEIKRQRDRLLEQVTELQRAATERVEEVRAMRREIERLREIEQLWDQEE